jgi:hypothetical protein
MKRTSLCFSIVLLSANLVFSQVSVTFDGSPADSSAIFEVKSTDKGVLIPRMTFEQRNVIQNPVEGLMLYCTNCDDDSTGVLCIFQGGKWINFYGECKVPKAPVAGTHTHGYTQIDWKWNAVPIALGYKWNTTSDYNSATDMGTATSKTETGLTCSKSYTRYLWAYNACGHSAPVSLIHSTMACACGTPITVNHITSGGVAPVNKTVTYGTVKNIPGEPSKCWITSNLGADHQATAVNDTTEASAGWYWQFNKLQGYKHDGTTRTPNTSWTYDEEVTDWTIANDPCVHEIGAGWRVPSYSEWTHVDSYGGWNNWNGPWNSALKIHAAGMIYYITGTLISRGYTGACWSRSQTYILIGEAGYYAGGMLYLTSSNCYTNYEYKSNGFSVRCLTDSLCPAPPDAPPEGTHIPLSDRITWNWDTIPCAIGYKWNDTNDYASAEDLSYLGTFISYDETGLECDSSYIRYAWAYNNYGHSEPTTLTQSTNSAIPATPASGIHVPAYENIVWKWNSVYDASGYKWNTTNNYSTATNIGTDTIKTETGLSCGTSYTRYLWAYNACGHSVSVSLTQSTLTYTCGDSVTINHVAGSLAPVNKTVTYGTISNIPGETSKCWITSNLGAGHQADSVDDATEASAGWYWQFNRQQGYRHDGSNVTPSWTITSISESFDWLAANDPCALTFGCDWRLPTGTEWTNVDASGAWTDWNGPWNSALKMHAAGYINASNGLLTARGAMGFYWSNNQASNITGWALLFSSSMSGVGNYTKAHGFTVRCIK